MTALRILIACELSGQLRRRFRARGHYAYSCDTQPAQDGARLTHIQDDARNALHWKRWDMVIAHPPCTYLTVANAGHVKHGCSKYTASEARQLQDDAAAFFMLFANATHIPKRAIENPVGVMSSRYRKPDQILQPYQFGDDASKKTCLWLYGLPPLVIDPAARCDGRRIYNAAGTKYAERWANQTDSGQNRLPPSATRAQQRAETYPGIAEAMADQWSQR